MSNLSLWLDALSQIVCHKFGGKQNPSGSLFMTKMHSSSHLPSFKSGRLLPTSISKLVSPAITTIGIAGVQKSRRTFSALLVTRDSSRMAMFSLLVSCLHHPITASKVTKTCHLLFLMSQGLKDIHSRNSAHHNRCLPTRYVTRTTTMLAIVFAGNKKSGDPPTSPRYSYIVQQSIIRVFFSLLPGLIPVQTQYIFTILL